MNNVYLFENSLPHISSNYIYDVALNKFRPIFSSDFVGGTGGSDAFGRQRVSNPITLFDSSHRFKDNGLWNTSTTGTASASFNSNQGLIDLTINNSINAEIIRETTKVFSYQPGKSLLILNTFVMNEPKIGLRQRVGYYGNDNGIYFESDGATLNLVIRTIVGGSLSETRIPQSDWNGDKLDGTISSRFILNISKAQIFWMDIEWLGVGSVRTGFIIDGQYILCHTFHHANIIPSTYITTASLPLRYEIKNTAQTSSNSTLKQICSTVISEGGYELKGLQQAITIPVNAPRNCSIANTYYPVISLKLRSGFLDGIAILSALSMLGTGNNAIFNWQIVASGTTTGGEWIDSGANSIVQYNISGTSFSGGRILASGYLSSNAQGQLPIDIPREALFKFQLERNTFTSTPFEITLAVTSKVADDKIYASMDWEEVTR